MSVEAKQLVLLVPAFLALWGYLRRRQRRRAVRRLAQYRTRLGAV